MKKIIIAAISALALTSCATAYTTYTGDITWMNCSGQPVKTWKNAIIQTAVDGQTVQSPFNLGGWLEFTTADSTSVNINGGMVIIENIKGKTNYYTPEIESTKESYED